MSEVRVATYCGDITHVGSVTGGGYVGTESLGRDGNVDVTVGSLIRSATEISQIDIGGSTLRGVRVCVAALAPYVRQGDRACLFVYGHLLRKQVIIGVTSATGPSWTLPPGRLVTMLAAYALFWPILIGIPAVLGAIILGGFLGPGPAGVLGRLAFWYAVGISWLSGIRLFLAYRQMHATAAPL